MVEVNQRQRKWVMRGGIERGEYESSDIFGPQSSDTITKAFAETSYSLRKSRVISFLSLRANKGIDALGADDKGDPLASRRIPNARSPSCSDTKLSASSTAIWENRCAASVNVLTWISPLRDIPSASNNWIFFPRRSS